jgi:hypothetical protein
MTQPEPEREEVALHYAIPAGLHQRMKILAAQQGRTLKGWLVVTLQGAVEAQEAERAEQERRRQR